MSKYAALEVLTSMKTMVEGCGEGEHKQALLAYIQTNSGGIKYVEEQEKQK